MTAVVQHGLSLFPRHRRKPLQKLFKRRARTEVAPERIHRDTCPREDKSSAQDVRIRIHWERPQVFRFENNLHSLDSLLRLRGDRAVRLDLREQIIALRRVAGAAVKAIEIGRGEK